MSNGTPEIFEGGPEGPPGPLPILSLLYAIVWFAALLASLVFDLSFLTSRTWLVVTSIVLLAGALAVLAREIGFPGSGRKARPR